MVVGEPCSRPARVSRGPVSMNEITHIASSSETSPWVETNPPVERAATVPEAAPPPNDFSRERTWGSAPSGDDDAANYTTSGPNNPGWLEADPQGTHGRDYPQGLDAAAWAAASPVGSRTLGAQRSAPTGDVEANYTTMGLDGPPKAWSCGAADRDGSANAASQVGIHTAGTHAPAGMHEACDTEEAPGADRNPRHGSRDHGTQWYYGARWHPVPPPSDEAYGAPGEGALEWEQLRLQSQSLLTPAALGDGVRRFFGARSARALGARARDLDREVKMLFNAMETEAEAQTDITAERTIAARAPPPPGWWRWSSRR